ncbi:HDIG domain-containing metalloprotein [Alkaliphilus serpentinus]|uniref:HDIG domain-containing protein n=1 Tax=Alkaliphilus serpentinus TaxID=1482731 RepID=A0A833HP63_9FIRM|nr:HDIG domain-containing metalloprotein [Alkaliphilus serpentinus]KAB3530446.1 HDIG domain-containing protein [Alkaliphilus serpentinus]
MLYRIKQVFYGLTAKMSGKDHEFVREYLTPNERALFYRLRVGEQVHSVKVAYGCYQEKPTNRKLIKAALLHDVGKVESNLNIFNKVIVVILAKHPVRARLLPFFIKKALFYKNHHPKIAVEFLHQLRLDKDIIYLVENHHKLSTNEDINLIQKYDNMY